MARATRALITAVLLANGPMKLTVLQKVAKVRRAQFLKSLKYLVKIGEVIAVGRGVKGAPVIYSISSQPNDISTLEALVVVGL